MPVADDSFTITLNGQALQFTWVSGTADDSGHEVTIGLDEYECGLNLAAALVGNVVLSETFRIVNGGGLGAILTAHGPGAVAMTFDEPASSVLTWTEVTPGAQPQYNSNYKALCRLLVRSPHPSTAPWHRGPALMADPDTQQVARWQLGQMLLPTVRHTWPPYWDGTNNDFTPCFHLLRHFVVQRWEQYGTPPTPNRIYQSETKVAWYAGSRVAEHAKVQDIFALVRRTDILNPFLTYRGRAGRHEVSQPMQHYLGYYRRTADLITKEMHVQATVHYSDGTTAYAVPMVAAWLTYKPGTVGMFPAGFEQLGLHNLQPTKRATHYVLTVGEEAETPLSEAHTFHLVPHDANELHIHYINSLGVVDTIRCDGRWEQGMRVENSPVERTPWPGGQDENSTDAPGGRRHVLTGVDQYMEVSTGYMDRSELEACMDILFSPEWRWDDHRMGKRLPLQLVAAEHVMKTQGDPRTEHLYALNLRFVLGDREMAWSMARTLPPVPITPDPGAGDAPDDPGGGTGPLPDEPDVPSQDS